MLSKESKSRERILLYGPWNTGKTTSYFEIAKLYRKTKTVGKFYVLDTDYTTERTVEEYPGCEENMQFTTSVDIDEIDTTLSKYKAKSTAEDWLVIDTASELWEICQNAFTQKIMGKDLADWTLEYRKANPDGGNALTGAYGANWDVIKKMYGGLVQEIVRFPGHVLVTAKAKDVQQPDRKGEGGDTAEIRGTYGPFGVRPAGEKNLPYLFHTVLWMGEKKVGDWVYSSVKDRGRERVMGGKMDNFVASYLMKVAGWTM